MLLTEDWRGRLGDFGLARLLSSQQSNGSVIHTTTIVGTRVYMAHETAHGKISRKSDVYSLGVVRERVFQLLFLQVDEYRKLGSSHRIQIPTDTITTIFWNISIYLTSRNTVEPPRKGHFGTNINSSDLSPL